VYNDQGGQDAVALDMTTIDTFLKEKNVVAGPEAVAHRHEGVDENGDGEPDGILTYQLQANDPDANMRVIWTASDACGVQDADRRTHDSQRMLAANKAGAADWAMVFVGGSYAGSAWHAAVCRLDATEHRTTLFPHLIPGNPGHDCRFAEEQVLEALPPETADNIGTARAAVNGGLFNHGGLAFDPQNPPTIIGEFGSGTGWHNDGNFQSFQRDAFGMAKRGSSGAVLAEWEASGKFQAPPPLKKNPFGASSVGMLLHPDTSHGADIQWPEQEAKKRRTLICMATKANKPTYFVMVVACNPFSFTGWTWTETVDFLNDGALLQALRAEGLPVDGVTRAVMLDGGASTQLAWARICRLIWGNIGVVPTAHTGLLPREVPNVVEAWNVSGSVGEPE